MHRGARRYAALILLITPAAAGRAQATGSSAAIVVSEFIYDSAAFPSAHASTIIETRDGLLAAWFGGKSEGASDVAIWSSRNVAGRWSPPVELANGTQRDGVRYPCWNPVLFHPRNGPLMLFYKVGPNPRAWWGMVRTSVDDGHTWGAPQRLPDGILGPIKNKPVQLANGIIVSPSSTEAPDNANAWRVHFELSSDTGRTWTRTADLGDDAIQPTLLVRPDRRLLALVRGRTGKILETWSTDDGAHWQSLTPTALPNPNAGIDGVILRDGRLLVVYNHATNARSPLNVAVSQDGATWDAAVVLESEPGEYSYPAVIQTAEGMIHITYTWRRQRIRHVVIDPAKLRPIPMPAGKWP